MHPVNALVRSPEVPPPQAGSTGTRSRPPSRTLEQTVAPASGAVLIAGELAASRIRQQVVGARVCDTPLEILQGESPYRYAPS
ncbi:MAG: hypothetical protein ACLQCU_15830 [Acidimicrobiales bacterium]